MSKLDNQKPSVFNGGCIKYLITGGCGFIGSNYIRRLLSQTDHKVVNVDCLTYAGRLENLVSIEKDLRYKHYIADIRCSTTIDTIFKIEHPDVVVHFAAESHVDRSIKEASVFIQTNVLGTFNMLEASKKFGISRFHHISTDEVYGAIPYPKVSIETDALDPRSPYSSSKASSDLLVMSYFTTHNLPITISRASNNYGPYQFPEKLIPLSIINLLRNQKVPIYGDGLQIREWMEVGDHCEAIDCILAKGKIGEIYNIGSGMRYTNLVIINNLIKTLGRDASYIEHIEDRKGHDRRYAIDCTKLRNLGWVPQERPFDVSFNETIEWYKKNEWWWSPLINTK